MRKELSRELNKDNQNEVVVVTQTTMPRYEGRIMQDNQACEWYVQQFNEDYPCWIGKNDREGFHDAFNNVDDWEPTEDGSFEDDLQSFQEYLDKKYTDEKHVAFALGAYVHSNVSFQIAKERDTRCRWDSGTIGFVGIPETLVDKVGEIASTLSDAWNGDSFLYDVYDELNQESVEGIQSLDVSWNDLRAWMKTIGEKYEIDWDKVEVRY